MSKKDDDYLKETELRKAKNYNARMDIRNEFRDTKSEKARRQRGAIVLIVLIMIIIGSILELCS